MSPQKNKLLSGFLAFVGIPALLLASAIKPTNAHAEGVSSYFDGPAVQCVIDSYNTTNDTQVTSIEEIDFDKVTALNCESYTGAYNFRGIVLFKNLESISLPGSAYLYDMDFSQNTKLKRLVLFNHQYGTIDLSHNTELEYIIVGTDSYDYFTFSAGISKLNDDDEYSYGIDLNEFKWFNTFVIDAERYPYRYDEDTNVLLFKEKNKIPYYIQFTDASGTRAFNAQTRSGYAEYRIFLEGDEEIETHNPIYIRDDCQPVTDPYSNGIYYSCSSTVYNGEEIDTDDYIENTLKKIFNLEAYDLSKVEIVPPTAAVDLSVDTDTSKKGIILYNANFTLDFHFTLKSNEEPEPDPSGNGETDEPASSTPTVPNTGLITNEEGGVHMTNIAIIAGSLIMAALAAFGISRRFRVHKF